MVDGGSVYRVFKGVILCRQRILAVSTVGEGVAARCEITLDETLVRVAPTPRRAFQGWRYLDPKDAPPDLDAGGLRRRAGGPGPAVARSRGLVSL